MQTVTATEASRSFAALLDGAARGETTVITRGGRRIALIGPATAANGSSLLAYLDTALVDDEFETDVRAARESALPEGPAWPAD
jgi:antitoxin (DNA-binding transcriptional repressor) of toxin-antitoxin stability system